MQGSVHHELLLALSGYPGSIFRVSKEDSSIEVINLVTLACRNKCYCGHVFTVLPP